MKINVIVPPPAKVTCKNCEQQVDKVARFRGPDFWNAQYDYKPRQTTVDLCADCLKQGLEALGA